MTQTKELRTLSLETRDMTFDDGSLKVSGYVNKAGSVSQVMGSDNQSFQETIEPLAFQNALLDTSHPIDFYAEHDRDKLLATTVNSSLKLRADDNGLFMEACIIDTTLGRDTYQLIKCGVISNMSFGFIVLDEDWDRTPKIPLRIVKELILFEVSAVRFPAYLESSIEARDKKELKALEQRGFKSVSNITIPKEEDILDLRNAKTEDLLKEIEARAIVKRDDDEPVPADGAVVEENGLGMGMGDQGDGDQPHDHTDLVNAIVSALTPLISKIAKRDDGDDIAPATDSEPDAATDGGSDGTPVESDALPTTVAIKKRAGKDPVDAAKAKEDAKDKADDGTEDRAKGVKPTFKKGVKPTFGKDDTTDDTTDDPKDPKDDPKDAAAKKKAGEKRSADLDFLKEVFD